MLRVALHAVLAASLAGPAAEVRAYAGVDGVPAAEPVPVQRPGQGQAGQAEQAPRRPDDPAASAEDAAGEAPSTSVLPESPARAGPAPAEPAPATATPEGPAEAAAVEEDDGAIPYDPLVDSPEAIRARSWVRSGAVLTAVGGVLAIGGVAMAAAPVNSMEMQDACNPRRDPAGNGCQEEGRNRAAAALGVPGALLLAGGIAMLVVGKLQQRRLRASVRLGLREVSVGLRLSF